MIIELEGMEFYAFHGYFEVEKIAGTHFLVNLKIEIGNNKAGYTDRLEDTLDYQKVYQIVKEEMAIPSNLLEHVSHRIIHRIKQTFPEASGVTVKVSKINPPLGGPLGKVSVTMEE
jgi:7,8-dihydroneopterin aldolase/epimerase/oxygenase